MLKVLTKRRSSPGKNWLIGWEEKWRLKLTSVKVEVEVEAEFGNIKTLFIFSLFRNPFWPDVSILSVADTSI